MDGLFAAMKPSFAGVLNLSKFIKGVEKYAKSQNINLKGFRSKKIPTFKNAVQYIKDGFKRDCPVALNVHLNWKAKLKPAGAFSGEKTVGRHWVTITGIEDKTEGRKRTVTLIVSSWGKEYKLDFSDVYYYSSYWAIIYFLW